MKWQIFQYSLNDENESGIEFKYPAISRPYKKYATAFKRLKEIRTKNKGTGRYFKIMPRGDL